MFTVDTLVHTVLFILIVGCIAGLLWSLIGYAEREGLQPPFPKIARIAMVVFGVLLLIGLLMHLAGHPIIQF